MKYINKELATSLTSLIFVVISVTGVLIYFHILRNTMNLYIGISIAFILVALLHVFFKTKAMKSYFPRGIFLSSTVAMAIMFIVFSFNSPAASSPQMGYINSVVNDVPVENSFIILGNNIAIVKDEVKDSRIEIKDNHI